MKKDFAMEEQLRQAVMTAHDVWLQTLPSPDACEYEFSEEFHRSLVHYVKRNRETTAFIRRAAAAVLALLAAGTLWLTFDRGARAYLFGSEWDPVANYATLRTLRNSPITAVQYYDSSSIPAGFEEIIELREPTARRRVYRNAATGELLLFSCSLLTEETILFSYDLITEETSYRSDGNGESILIPVTVKERPADLYVTEEDGGTNILIWTDEGQNVLFVLKGDVKPSELLRFAEGVGFLGFR